MQEIANLNGGIWTLQMEFWNFSIQDLQFETWCSETWNRVYGFWHLQRNPRSEMRNWKLSRLMLICEISNLRPRIWNPQSDSSNPKSEILNLQSAGFVASRCWKLMSDIWNLIRKPALSNPKCKTRNLNGRHMKNSSFWRAHLLSQNHGALLPWLPGIWKLKTEIWNLKYWIWNLKSGIWNLESEIWNLKSEIWNLKSGIWNPKSEIDNLKSEMWNMKARNTKPGI